MTDDLSRERARTLLYTAAQLMALARDLESDGREEFDAGVAKLEPSDSVLVELARQIYGARRKRSVLTEWAEFFGEPAWDLMLDLFIAAHEGRDVSISSACIAAEVPKTTALRWLNVLEKEGIIVRDGDRHDHRRSMVRISTKAFAEIARYLRHIADGHSAFVLLKPGSRAEASVVV
jgi:hypothetical protein